jgi:hypothetical protein
MTTNGKLITAREIDGELWVRAADVETRISYTQAADGEAAAGLSDEALGELWQEINNAAARITPDRKPVWLTFARKVEAAVLARAAQSGQRASVAEGWKLVPIEPTLEMKSAMVEAFMARKEDGTVAHELNRATAAYKAMLAASTQQENK